MNSKETLINAIELKATDRVPVTLLSGGIWTFNRRGISLKRALEMGAEQQAEILAETNNCIHSDIVWPGSGYSNIILGALGTKIKFREHGAPDVIEPLIGSAAELDSINLSRVREDEDINTLWETGRKVIRSIGSETAIGASLWAPFTLAGLMLGAEKLLRFIYRDKAAAHRTLEFCTDLCCEYLFPHAEAGVDLLSVADPTSSGDMISKKQFEEFSLPYLKKVITKLKEKGPKVEVHICGNISDRLELIPETGADMVSLDYKVNLKSVRKILNSKMAFAGNMNPVDVMEDMRPGEVAVNCLKCIEEAGAGNGYVLMPGCDIPPGVPVENIIAMIETAHNYRIGI